MYLLDADGRRVRLKINEKCDCDNVTVAIKASTNKLSNLGTMECLLAVHARLFI